MNHAIKFDLSNPNTFRNCSITKGHGHAIALTSVSGCKFEGNIIKDCSGGAKP